MNADIIAREFDLRARDETEARSILDTAAADGRDLTAEENQRWDALVASADTRKARIAQLRKMDEDAAELAAITSATATRDSGAPAGDSGDRTVIRHILQAQTDYRRGLEPSYGFELPIDMAQVRAIADFSDSGSLYVSDFANRVVAYGRTMSPWFANATVITASNGRPLVLPNETTDPTTYTPGEGTAITESTPTLGSVTASPTGYKALSYVSVEAEEDELVGLMQVITRSQGRSIGLAFGSAETTAILTAATNGGTASGVGGNGTATVTFVGYEDLLDLKYGAPAPYRLTGSWVMSNGMIKKVRKYKDSNGEYFWQPAIAAGQPDTFDGQPVYEDPYLAAPASATKSVVYGDLSAWIIKAMPLRVAVSTEARFANDQIAIKSVLRAGGALPDALALRYLVSANT